jgi:preprotein translocase subunit YajC
MSKEAINMLLLLAAVLVYFFLIFRAPMKRRKELKKFIESLAPGDKIITSSGIHGKVLEIADTTILISSEGSKLRVDKNSIVRSSEELVSK